MKWQCILFFTGFRVYYTDEPEIEIDLADMEAFPSSFSPNEQPATPPTTNDTPEASSFSQMMKPASSPAWPNTNNNSSRCWGKSSFNSGR